MVYRICDTNGNCAEFSDAYIDATLRNKKLNPDIKLKNGKILQKNEETGEFEQIGTFTRPSFDDLPDTANQVISEMAARAPAMNEAIAGFPARTSGMLIGELDRRTSLQTPYFGAPIDEGMPFTIGVRVPAPKKLPAFPAANRVKPKTSVKGGGGLRARWKDNQGGIYEWDSQHGKVERYDRRGRHLGEFDPSTGAQTKPADPNRRVEP